MTEDMQALPGEQTLKSRRGLTSGQRGVLLLSLVVELCAFVVALVPVVATEGAGYAIRSSRGTAPYTRVLRCGSVLLPAVKHNPFCILQKAEVRTTARAVAAGGALLALWGLCLYGRRGPTGRRRVVVFVGGAVVIAALGLGFKPMNTQYTDEDPRMHRFGNPSYLVQRAYCGSPFFGASEFNDRFEVCASERRYMRYLVAGVALSGLALAGASRLLSASDPA